MIAATGYADKRVAVLGLGRTGLSAARSLRKGGAQVIAWDDDEKRREVAAEAGFACQDPARRDWSDIAALVLSPGIAHTHPKPHHAVELARAVGVPVIGDTEIFACALNAMAPKDRPMVFGITGTNGKSTTTALLTHVLRACGRDAHAGGNIGTACLDLPAPHSGMIYVLELSSYQLELTGSLHCDGAIWLNLSPDHLERHGGLDGYIAAKQRVFANQTGNDVAIIAMDDGVSQRQYMACRQHGAAPVVPVSANSVLSHGISCAAGKLYDSCEASTAMVADLRSAEALRGRHNGLNAAAAYAAARHAGLAADAIAAAMQGFPGLAHRMEDVGTVQGVHFVNDSKATNAEAARQALAAFDNIFWIAGGRPKAGGLKGLKDALGGVQEAFLIGEAQKSFAKQLEGQVKTHLCGTLEVALARAFDAARASRSPDPVVLLSPACASFDQFEDFEARGTAFKAAIRALTSDDAAKRRA